ncbi:MAG: Gfo/Idh/MocA family protein [Candidatus Dormibacteria bacterium]
MRALVLGCGSVGSRHARNLVSLGLELVVADVDEEASRTLAGATGATAVTPGTAPHCELVVVATPSAHHVDDLRWALDRGADVFVEKPLAASRDGVATARALARQHPDRIVMVGCNLRFSEGFAALSANLTAIGRPAALLVDYGWWLPAWRPAVDYRTTYSARRALGGGIVLDAIHEIDYTVALAGPVEDVQGSCVTTGILEIDVEDVADITLRHRGGAQSHLHLDCLRRRYSRRCTVIGSEAEITWDVPRATVELRREAGAAPETVAAGLDSDPNTQYVAEMRHMLAAMTTRAPTCNDVERAAATVEIALRARDGGAR